MLNEGFKGWYFKHQGRDGTVAFIPGRSKGGAFVQMLTDNGSRQYDLPVLEEGKGEIRVGDCRFSSGGCHIDLPDVRGDISFGPLCRLRSDIMGPFSHLPMQCRHGVISMGHDLRGGLKIDGRPVSFDGGRGYIEMDSGRSFPRSYLWVQCNDFQPACSLMLSIAHIPFGLFSFRGCICAIIWQGRGYRLATYSGVRILDPGPEHVALRQGGLKLDLWITPGDEGHKLSSPVAGRMDGTIRESHNASLRACLKKDGEVIFDLTGGRASFEYVL